jgi:hypothetical protein
MQAMKAECNNGLREIRIRFAAGSRSYDRIHVTSAPRSTIT